MPVSRGILRVHWNTKACGANHLAQPAKNWSNTIPISAITKTLRNTAVLLVKMSKQSKVSMNGFRLVVFICLR